MVSGIKLMSRKEVIDKTLGEIRTFLDELSNGTSHYRSLHNLTEQVEHQYHGRFLIELIQNAHDALAEAGTVDTPQRIEIVLVEDEDQYGALYIANDGQPLTWALRLTHLVFGNVISLLFATREKVGA